MSVLLSIFKQPVLCGFFMVVASCCFISKNFSSFSYSVITIVAMQTLDKLCVSNKKKRQSFKSAVCNCNEFERKCFEY